MVNKEDKMKNHIDALPHIILASAMAGIFLLILVEIERGDKNAKIRRYKQNERSIQREAR